MDKEEYIKRLRDYNTWFNYAMNQKFVGDKILYNCIMKKKFLIDIKKHGYNDFITLWSNVHYHYGIGIENGLKGLIIKYQPDKINIDINENDVILKNIGGKCGKSHNLLSLANTSGILDPEKKLYTYDLDYKALKEVLKHLSDMIKWGARYPIPNNPQNIYKYDNSVPHSLIYGFHLLDVIDPLFNLFEKEKE
jgi:hypothetical protein